MHGSSLPIVMPLSHTSSTVISLALLIVPILYPSQSPRPRSISWHLILDRLVSYSVPHNLLLTLSILHFVISTNCLVYWHL